MSFADLNRIKVVYHDLSKPGIIKMIPGHATFIDFPCGIEEVVFGIPGGFKNSISKTDPKRLWLLALPQAKNSNLIVHCDKVFFVFDLVINSKNHSDVVQIASSYNGPEVEMNQSLYQKMPSEKMKDTHQEETESKPILKSDDSQKKEIIENYDFNKIKIPKKPLMSEEEAQKLIQENLKAQEKNKESR
jgi:hypothetical protein